MTDETTARNDINALTARYTWAIDGGNFDELGRLFAHGRVVQSPDAANPDAPGTGGEDLVALLRDMVVIYDDGTPRVRHATLPSVLTFQDEDSASGRADFTILQQSDPTLPITVVACGHYQDRFARVDGTWTFRERRIFIDMQSGFDGHVRGDYASTPR